MNSSYPHGGYPFRPSTSQAGTQWINGITEQQAREHERKLSIGWDQLTEIPLGYPGAAAPFFNMLDYESPQAAIDACEEAGGGKVVFPESFSLSTSLQVTSKKLILEFGGIDTCTIKMLADVPAIVMVGQPTYWSSIIGGVTIDYSGLTSPTSDAVLCRTKGFIENVRGVGVGGAVVHIRCEVGDNCNQTRVRGVSGTTGSGDVVRISKAEEAINNINALDIDVMSSYLMGGYAIRAEGGFGSDFRVQHVEGSTHTGAVYLNTFDVRATVVYAEGNINKVFVCAGSQNECYLVHTATGGGNMTVDDVFVDSGGNNYFKSIYGIGSGGFEIKTAGGWEYRHSLSVVRSSGAVFTARQTGDAFNRVEVRNTGEVRMGDGTAAPVKVLGQRMIRADLANTPNTGNADTDLLIDALRDIIIGHGLGAAS